MTLYAYVVNYYDSAIVGIPVELLLQVDYLDGTTDYTVDWGDGTVDHDNGASHYSSLVHTYTAPGTYTITATASNVIETVTQALYVQLDALAPNAYPAGAINLADEGSLTFSLSGAPRSLDLPNPLTGPSTVNLGGYGLVTQYSDMRGKWFRWIAPRNGVLNITIQPQSATDSAEGVITDATLVLLNQLYARHYSSTGTGAYEGTTGVQVRKGEAYLFYMGITSYYSHRNVVMTWGYQRRSVAGRCVYIGTGYVEGASMYAVGVERKNVQVVSWRTTGNEYPLRLASDGARTVYQPITHDYSMLSYPSTAPKGLIKIVNGWQEAPLPSDWSYPSTVVPPWEGENLNWDLETKRFVGVDRDYTLLPSSVVMADTGDKDRAIVAFDEAGLLDYWIYPENTVPPRPWLTTPSTYTQHFFQPSNGQCARGEHFWCAELVRPNSSNGLRDIVRWRLDAGHVATEVLRFTPTYTNMDGYDQGFLYFTVNQSETKMVVCYRRTATDIGPANPYGFNGWYTGGMWLQVYDLTTAVPTMLDEFQFLPYPVIANSYNSRDGYDTYNFYAYGVVEFDPDDDTYIWMLNNGSKRFFDDHGSHYDHRTFLFRMPLFGSADARSAAMATPYAQFQMDLAEETPWFTFGSMTGPEPTAAIGSPTKTVHFQPHPTGGFQ